MNNTLLPERLYILMRNDLQSMNPGKAMAQACHGANQFIHEWGHKKAVRRWQKEGNGFGTTIVLSVDKEILHRVMSIASGRTGIPYGRVVDTTYPMTTTKEIASLLSYHIQSDVPVFKDNGQVIVFRSEITCGYIFLKGNSPESDQLVAGLPLHP